MNEKEIYKKILDWLNDNREVAIANVIKTWGSSPRPVGSIMAVNDQKEIIGSVSGGCVESYVFAKSLEVLKTNKVEILDFGVSNSKAWEVGLTCGGKIKILLEKLSYKHINFINIINNSFLKSKSILLATRLTDGKKEFLDSSCIPDNIILKNNFNVISQLTKSEMMLLSDESWFIKVFKNQIKLVLIGAVHIAEPLINYANNLAYEIHLIDPRDSFNEKNFNNISIHKEWPDEALKKINLDADTAIVTLTHDPKLEDPAIEYSLKTNVFYIGCLGSTKTHSSRVTRLRNKGIKESDIIRLHGPVGLDINAKTPSEIAVSIVSQIIKVKNEVDA